MIIEKKSPKLSVIIATYNRADILKSAVDSILNQSFQDFELILIDDASEDDTQKVLDELREKDKRIRFFSNDKNLGNGPTRNIGLNASRGEYIAMLGDDDISLPNRLEVQQKYLNDHPDVNLVFSTYFKADNNLSILGVEPKNIINGEFPDKPPQIFRQLYLDRCDIVDSSCMFRRKILKHVGGYGTTSTGTDRTFFLKIAAKGYQIKAIQEPLIIVRSSSNYHQHLQANRSMVYENRVKVVRATKAWLKDNSITEFDHLHAKALSNALTRQARSIGGIKGFFLCSKALLIQPGNKNTQKTYKWFLEKLKNKII